jgi:hypothetical protein
MEPMEPSCRPLRGAGCGVPISLTSTQPAKENAGMSKPTPQAFMLENATLRSQLVWAEASILLLVETIAHLNRSVHEFEATHPAVMSEQIQVLLQQIRQSRPGPLPAPRPASTPEPPQRRRIQHRKTNNEAAA